MAFLKGRLDFFKIKAYRNYIFGSIILKFESKHGQIFSFIFMVFSGLWHQSLIHFSLSEFHSKISRVSFMYILPCFTLLLY